MPEQEKGVDKRVHFCCPLGAVHVLHREDECCSAADWPYYCAPAVSLPPYLSDWHHRDLEVRVQRQLATDREAFERCSQDFLATLRTVQPGKQHLSGVAPSSSCSQLLSAAAVPAPWDKATKVKGNSIAVGDEVSHEKQSSNLGHSARAALNQQQQHGTGHGSRGSSKHNRHNKRDTAEPMGKRVYQTPGKSLESRIPQPSAAADR